MDLVPKDYKKNIDQPNFPVINHLSTDSLKNRKKNKYLFGPGVVVFLFFLLVVSLAIYGALLFYKSKIEKEIEANKKTYIEIIERQDTNLLKKIVDQGKTASLLSELLAARPYASNLFKALSEVTLPQVQWNSFYVSDEKNIVVLSGSAANYSVLARQMTAFKDNKNWNGADFSSIVLDKLGTVTFSAAINFNPSLLINK